MQRSTRFFALLLLAGTLIPAAAQASILGNMLPSHAYAFAKAKKVNIYFLNTTDAARSIKVEDQAYSVAPHQKISVSAPVGAKVIAADSGNTYKEGDVLLTVSADLKDATVSLK